MAGKVRKFEQSKLISLIGELMTASENKDIKFLREKLSCKDKFTPMEELIAILRFTAPLSYNYRKDWEEMKARVVKWHKKRKLKGTVEQMINGEM